MSDLLTISIQAPSDVLSRVSGEGHSPHREELEEGASFSDRISRYAPTILILVGAYFLLAATALFSVGVFQGQVALQALSVQILPLSAGILIAGISFQRKQRAPTLSSIRLAPFTVRI